MSGNNFRNENEQRQNSNASTSSSPPPGPSTRVVYENEVRSPSKSSAKDNGGK